jgi:amino acid permease
LNSLHTIALQVHQNSNYDAVSPQETKPSDEPSLLYGNIGRGCLVLVLGFTAVNNVDKLDKIVSLLGSLFGVPLGCIFPSFIHMQLSEDQSPWMRYVNMGVVVLGTVLCLSLSGKVIATW